MMDEGEVWDRYCKALDAARRTRDEETAAANDRCEDTRERLERERDDALRIILKEVDDDYRG